MTAVGPAPAAWDPDDGPTLYVDRNAEGATRISAWVTDGRDVWSETVCYYLWETDDGDPRDAYLEHVRDHGWTFDD